MSPKMPDVPYIAMPALRRYRLSVAPVLIVGTTGTPGHSSFVTRSIALSTSGRSGEGGLGLGSLIGVIEIRSSLTTLTSVCRIASAVSVGRMRQLTVARAVCGNAFSACPASSIVATQVVRIVALYAA